MIVLVQRESALYKNRKKKYNTMRVSSAISDEWGEGIIASRNERET